MSIAVTTRSPFAARMRPPYPMQPLSVDEYHAKIRAGELTEADPVELLEGWVVVKMSRNPPHDTCLGLTQDCLNPLLPAGWHLRVQSAITLTDSEPEPDIAVVEGGRRVYRRRHPSPAEIGLVIEVAETSLLDDRVEKGRIYARAGLPVYWVINLIDRQVEVFTNPDAHANPPAYAQPQVCRVGQTVPLVLKGLLIAQIGVADLMP